MLTVCSHSCQTGSIPCFPPLVVFFWCPSDPSLLLFHASSYYLHNHKQKTFLLCFFFFPHSTGFSVFISENIRRLLNLPSILLDWHYRQERGVLLWAESSAWGSSVDQGACVCCPVERSAQLATDQANHTQNYFIPGCKTSHVVVMKSFFCHMCCFLFASALMCSLNQNPLYVLLIVLGDLEGGVFCLTHFLGFIGLLLPKDLRNMCYQFVFLSNYTVVQLATNCCLEPMALLQKVIDFFLSVTQWVNSLASVMCITCFLPILVTRVEKLHSLNSDFHENQSMQYLLVFFLFDQIKVLHPKCQPHWCRLTMDYCFPELQLDLTELSQGTNMFFSISFIMRCLYHHAALKPHERFISEVRINYYVKQVQQGYIFQNLRGFS
ncbi:hypothetical protein VP01_2366g2 [Puccinia sorghi]|uniref:Uncharacterized protein n=1 Tax=Puccinia sorghi TaxID=27349 RepID=A0A0L6V727_9BASI|nr:hypothetical protein VP01_2366g2 [Puccinia sorghi]